MDRFGLTGKVCATFICSDCLNAQDVMRATFEGHKVMPVKEFQTEDYEALLKRQPFYSQQYHEWVGGSVGRSVDRSIDRLID